MTRGEDSRWRAEVRRWIDEPGARVHLMGIGGMGMAGVARLLAARDLRVDGCDSGAPRTLAWLRACGIPATTGHDPAHLDGVDWAIYSPALQPGHPERVAAQQKKIALFPRGQVLPVLAEDWKTIAVAGSHGKTTTAAMLAHILRASGVDASWCIGGELPPDGAPAGVGGADWLVIEADESDGTLAHYAPELAIITNIEFDHMEHFSSNADMEDCFRTYARQARGVIVGADDPVASKIGRALGGVSFGFAADADIRVDIREAGPAGTRFQITLPGGRAAMAYLPLTGRHNVLNAAAALAACDCQGGGGMEAACAALATFALPKRRFESVADARGIRVVADYAHHPSEIRALVAAARQAGADRIWAVFQPHRYTRTRALGAIFPAAFAGVAGVVLLPVYAASEPPLAGGSSADLLMHFQRDGTAAAELADDLPNAADRIESRWRAGDCILIVGAGDVEQIGPMLAARLEGAGANDSSE